jgi:hypothetical protein
LISVLYLDKDNIHYRFRNEMFIIKFNVIGVGLAIRQDKIYLLSNCDHVNEIKSYSSVNVCDASVKRKRDEN